MSEDRDGYEAALPGLLAAREEGTSREIELGIIQCMVRTDRVFGLAAVTEGFISSYGVHRENDMLAVCEAFDLCQVSERALEVLRVYTFNYPDTVLFTYYRSVFLLRTEHYDQAKDGFQQCLALGFEDHGVLGGLAVCYFMQGNFTKAIDVSRTRRDHQQSSVNNIYVGEQYHQAIATGRGLLKTYSQRLNMLDPGEAFSPSNEELRIMVSGDSLYLHQYLGDFLGSVMTSGSSACVHIHAILANDEDTAFLRGIVGQYTALKLTCSYEFQDVTHTGRVYFSTARFMALHTLYHGYGLRGCVYVLDMDSSVRGDLSELTTYVRDQQAEIALRFRSEPFLEHRIAAGGVYLDGSDAAISFINEVAAYIAFGLFADVPYWYLDQLALLLVNEETKHKSPSTRIADLPSSYLDWYKFDDSLVWTDKGGKET